MSNNGALMVTKSQMSGALSIVVLGFASIAWGQQATRSAYDFEQRVATTSEATMSPSATSRAAESLLRMRVESVNWIDKPFEDVIEWLRDLGEGRVNVVPKWNALDVESVTRDNTVTLQLNNTTVAEVLNETLEQLTGNNELTYRGIENKLTISTHLDFDRKLEMRVYDATDLLFRVPDFGQGAPVIDLQKTNSGGGGGGGGGGGSGQSVFGGGSGGGATSQQDNESGQQADQLNEQRLTKLKEAIQRTIAPDSWDRSGTQGAGAQSTGGRGRIEVYRKSLIISNTIEVHEMIAGAFYLDK